ncbi:MAG: hypothetical protein COV44_06755 [Deltaproteobacteria bacterium CG11_big_fil_rev_8_21_14_0_20_45_16]|nr:MAG: hypothetical protein COV44_06755 [Deltaproteobacteria bacterium CG11_big_fil_rev_8_21_14_0_20_45_16]
MMAVAEEQSQDSMEFRRPKILIVDDEVAMVRSLELLLRPVGDIVKAYSVPEAEEHLGSNIDCIITDVCMPEASGMSLLEKVKRYSPETPVIVMTAYSTVPEAVEAIQMGAFEYLTKPFENADLIGCVKRAVEKKGLIVGETKNIPEGWVCNSEAMKDCVQKLEKQTLTASPVLIVGEKGVGKKRAARWMFERGRSKKAQFCSFDGGMYEEESPLFKEKLARSSFVFISEIFQLTRKLQDRVMDLVADGKIKLVGGTSVNPDVQRNEGFREDLYELLTTHIVRMPSLKDRAADFDALCYQFLESMRLRMQLPSLSIDEQALNILRKRNFIANVHELEQVLERAAIETRTGVIVEKNFVNVPTEDLMNQLPFSIPIEGGWLRLEYLLRALEKDVIERAIEKYPKTSNSQIASILGTTRRILELRMKSFRIWEG